ncbi:macrolide ABC transporter ATP-binding protein [Alicyclobacillus fastidiosus]|nr:macrolide ABC transporter ATP-binding protein [Alicyclobacillus fastidiosus]
MGPSGSGKSTAMNMIGCLDLPTSGQYVIDGFSVSSLSEDQLADLRNRKIGFVFQSFNLLPKTTALENVELPMMYAGVPARARRQRAMEALARVGLADRMHNRPNELSGGQQQRVSIARALVNNPVLLLADEPTGALDSHTTEEILTLFEELHAQGNTIVIVTHEDEVGRRAKRIVRFRDGRVESDTQNERKEAVSHHVD